MTWADALAFQKCFKLHSIGRLGPVMKYTAKKVRVRSCFRVGRETVGSSMAEELCVEPPRCVLSPRAAGCRLRMALNVGGIVAVVVFYVLILAIGVWASKKSKKEEKKCAGSKCEVTMIGGRNIHLLVGIFTLTGRTGCLN